MLERLRVLTGSAARQGGERVRQLCRLDRRRPTLVGAALRHGNHHGIHVPDSLGTGAASPSRRLCSSSCSFFSSPPS